MSRTNLDNMVREYLSVESFNDKWDKDQRIGSGYFYELTYTPILSFFKEHQLLSDSLELKTALIFSWNPTICQVSSDRFTQAKNELIELEPLSKELNNTDILNLDTNTVIKNLWYPVKKATSLRDLTPGVSVTKFLLGNLSIISYNFSEDKMAKAIWRIYFKKMNAIVFVMDSSSLEAFEEAYKDLHRLSEYPECFNLPQCGLCRHPGGTVGRRTDARTLCAVWGCAGRRSPALRGDRSSVFLQRLGAFP